MQIEIRTLQVKKNSWVHELALRYEKKIAFYNPCNFRLIKSEKDFLKGINEKDMVIICDERGDAPSSKKFANQIKSYLESGKKNLFILIGGPFGFADDVKKRADTTLSLSHFVLNQEIAISVLMEQLFRALTINSNHPYHNE